MSRIIGFFKYQVTWKLTLVALFLGWFLACLLIIIATVRSEMFTADAWEESVAAQAKVFNDLFGRARKELDGLARNARSSCGEATLRRLRQAHFQAPLVAEFGLTTAEGRLVCTSWQRVDPPLSVGMPPTGDEPVLRGPISLALTGQDGVVLARRGAWGGEVNAVVPLQWLRGTLAAFGSRRSGAMLLGGAENDVIVRQGLGDLATTLLLSQSVPDGLDSRYVDDEAGTRWQVTTTPLAVLHNGSRLVAARPTRSLTAAFARWRVEFLLLWLVLGLLAMPLVAAVGRQMGDPRHMLQRGMKRDAFFNVYQPIVDVVRGQWVGVEVLMRMRDIQGKTLTPGYFIPPAEASGLIVPMTHTQMDRLEQDLAPLLEKQPDLRVTLNITAVHLRNPAFIRAAIELKQRLPGLVLELTENQVLEMDAAAIRHGLDELTQGGVALAIDDFGTGYTGLAYLQDLPFQLLKADRVFVAAAGTDSANAQVLAVIVQLAQRLGAGIVAEGVETEAQSELLQEMGVRLQQGFLYSRPVPAPELMAAWKQQAPKPGASGSV